MSQDCGVIACVSLCVSCVCVQLEAYEVSVTPDLQQQLAGVVEELKVQIPPPVSPRRLKQPNVLCSCFISLK